MHMCCMMQGCSIYYFQTKYKHKMYWQYWICFCMHPCGWYFKRNRHVYIKGLQFGSLGMREFHDYQIWVLWVEWLGNSQRSIFTHQIVAISKERQHCVFMHYIVAILKERQHCCRAWQIWQFYYARYLLKNNITITECNKKKKKPVKIFKILSIYLWLIKLFVACLWNFQPRGHSDVKVYTCVNITSKTDPLNLFCLFMQKAPLNKGVFTILNQIWPLNRFELWF